MKTIRKIEISITVSVLILIIAGVAGFAHTCDEVRQNVLRLHVVAASDSDEDQSLKLKVRDAVLKEGSDIFDGSVNMQNAVSKIEPELGRLTDAAQSVVRENGFDYHVKVTLKREFFTTRTYENVTLPAGKYLAVRVVIDEGKGHNWWCVMFPALCLPAASDNCDIGAALGEDGEKLVYKNPKYEPRFKIVEWIESVKNRAEFR